MVAAYLEQEGIASHVMEDVSYISVTWAGTASQLVRPRLFVSRSDAERAVALIVEYERRQRPRTQPPGHTTELVRADCGSCGREVSFPSAKEGTIQPCPACHEYMDVGHPDWAEEAEAAAGED